jgi:putative transposase
MSDNKHRHSIRLRGYDYSQEGAYFITICTHERKDLFGKVVDKVMRLNPTGDIVREVWGDLSRRFPGIQIDVSVVMPNHFHGIIFFVGAGLALPNALRAQQAAPLQINSIALPWETLCVPLNPCRLFQ